MTLVYLVAGEPSGDVIGARLMQALSVIRPDVRFAGVGGSEMAAHGLDSLFPMHELALMGLLEVLPKLRLITRRLKQTAADIAERRPSAIVTIDSPGFTLRLLKSIRHLGIPRAHYVAPQAWAWRESRVRKYPGLWDKLLCLLPFEPAFFARHGLEADFVGHPVLESGADRGDAARFRTRHNVPADGVVVTLMPGSRGGEIARLLPVLEATLVRVQAAIPNLVPVVAVAQTVAQTVIEATQGWRVRPRLVSGGTDKYDAFAASAAALTKSGTSTLELAMAGVPMIVAYRLNPVTAEIAKQVVRIPYASIINLLSDRQIVPEMIQYTCKPEPLSAALLGLLTDSGKAKAQRDAFSDVLAALCAPQGLPSTAAARAVAGLLDQNFVIGPTQAAAR